MSIFFRISALAAAVLLTACARSEPASSASSGSGALKAQCSDDLTAPIIVNGRGSRAMIERNPLRITYTDGAGQPVLRQVINELSAPYLPLNVPEPGGGSDAIPDQALYSPFTFEVGGAVTTQFPASPWQGNQLLGGSAGIQFSATQVSAASCDGDTATLTVATNDPSGRSITVVIKPDESGLNALQVKATLIPAIGVVAFSDSFDSGDDEEFFGFGGRHNALSQRGRSFPVWIEQENFGAAQLQPAVNVIPGTGGEGYQFPNGPTAAYYAQALFYSSRPYGFMLENTELSRFKLAYTARPDAWQVSAASAELRYVVAPGEHAQKIQTLTGINGRHRVPPEWALGPTLLRGIRVLSAEMDTGESYFQKVMADLDRVEQDQLPVTSYSVEGWSFTSRENLATIVKRLRDGGRHPMFYIRAYNSIDAANTEPASVFQDSLLNGYCAQTPLGGCYLFGSPFIAGIALLLDFTRTDTVDWWRGRVREMIELGADGFMQDFGESVMTDMRFANGETGLSMHNRYPVIFHETTRAVLDEYRAENPERAAQAGGEFYFFTRAGFSGRPGSAAFESANFPGDNLTDFGRSNGLGSAVSDMLNRGVGGAYGYTTDIGGYLDQLTGSPTKELFIRWSQFAALSPIFRVHNSSTTGTRMPWSYDEETLAIWTQMAELHLKAKPLILKLWREAQTSGLPITRPLWLVFPDDREGYAQDQQFMLGDEVLVAPVVIAGATSREVYFPQGCWQHAETAEQFTGPGSETVQAPLASLPYFFRCGQRPF